MSKEEKHQIGEYFASNDADLIKQVILVRDMRYIWKKHPGKLAGQVAHASSWFACQKLLSNEKMTADEKYWFKNGAAKIVKRGPESVKELEEIQREANEVGIITHLVLDHGKTVFDQPTITCLALGPDRVSRLDPIIRSFPLFN
jgi:peptidyl-tRNA hydrolase